MRLYLKDRAKLGSYSIVHLNTLQIVSDNSLNWLNKIINFQLKPSDYNSLNEILLSCQKIGKSIRHDTQHLHVQNRLAVVCSQLKAQRSVWYLDELFEKAMACEIILPILAQLLFEKTTILTSRLAVIRDKDNIQRLVLFVKMMDQADLLCFGAIEGRMSPISISDIRLDEDNFSIENIQTQDSIAKTGATLPIVGYNGKILNFTVYGRSPTDKKYEQDEKKYQNALSTDLVPVELYFHPYYRAFGHTTIRIGKTMYELSSSGWRAHGAPNSSARVFLFNNPFFKSQLENHRHLGMSSFSIGKTILLPKNQVELIHITLQNICSLRGFQKPQFNIITNNCNQGILRILQQCGLKDLRTNGYYGFSSILSFRRFLFDLNFEIETLQIYPMPGLDLNLSKMREEFPRWIYRHNSIRKELKRALPVYAFDTMRLPYLWIKRKVMHSRIGQYLNTNKTTQQQERSHVI